MSLNTRISKIDLDKTNRTQIMDPIATPAEIILIIKGIFPPRHNIMVSRETLDLGSWYSRRSWLLHVSCETLSIHGPLLGFGSISYGGSLICLVSIVACGTLAQGGSINGSGSIHWNGSLAAYVSIVARGSLFVSVSLIRLGPLNWVD